MNKLMKTVGKWKLWTVLAAVVIAAGIAVAAIFGFNADLAASDTKTLTVKLDSYQTDARVNAVKEICEKELDNAGLKDGYIVKGEFSGQGCEIIYVLSANADAAKLEQVKVAVGAKLETASSEEGNVLNNAFLYVSTGTEKAQSVLPAGYLWRGIVAAAVIAALEFVYVSIRFRLDMGAMSAAAALMSAALTVAFIALVRIPVTASVIYAAAFSMLCTIAMTLVSFNKMRSNFKSDEFKGKAADDAVVSSLGTKEILIFAVTAAIALVLVGGIAVANVRWFALAALCGVAVALYSSLIFMPAAYLPLKKRADKKAAQRARYDYKKDKKEDAKADSKEETTPAK